MAEFTKHKVLKKEFGRLQLNENDLHKLSRHFEIIAERYEAKPSIVISAADGEETIHTEDGEFFQSADMPAEISGIRFKLNDYQSPVSCNLTLSSNPPRFAELNVDGTDTAIVTASFHEIERELKSKQAGGTKLMKFVDTGRFHLIISLFVAASIYSVFDIILSALLKTDATSVSSDLYAIIYFIAWLCVIAGFIAGAYPIIGYIKKCFPPIEFTGKLNNHSKKPRKIIFVAFISILLPIFLNILSSLVYELVTKNS